MITAEEAADTIRLLVPGFVALKVFYAFGLRTRRSDLEWTVWSVLAAAVIDLLVGPARDQHVVWLDRIPEFLTGLVLAIGLGLVLIVGWRVLIGLRPRLRDQASRMAWDAVLSQPHWVQIWTNGGKTISGKVALIADPVETDDLDLYVTEPAWVDAKLNVLPMDGVEGVVVARSDIAFIQVFPNSHGSEQAN